MSFQALQQRQQQLDRLVLHTEIVFNNTISDATTTSDNNNNGDTGSTDNSVVDELNEKEVDLMRVLLDHASTDHSHHHADDMISEVDSQTVLSKRSHRSMRSTFTDISEVNSQQTMKSENLSGDGVDDISMENDDDDDEHDAGTVLPPLLPTLGGGLATTRHVANGILKPTTTTMKTTSLAANEDAKAAATEIHYDYQPSGGSTCENDDCCSLLSSSVASASSKGMVDVQPAAAELLVKQAQEQVIEAQHELAAVEARLLVATTQHQSELTELQDQLTTHKVIEKELTERLQSQGETIDNLQEQLYTSNVANETLQTKVDQLTNQVETTQQTETDHQSTIRSLETQVATLIADKEAAESKLQDALQRLKQLEQQLTQQSPSSKSVRFQEDKNVVVEYNDRDYVSQLYQSQQETAAVTTRLNHVKQTLADVRQQHTDLEQRHTRECERHAVELETERTNNKNAQSQVKSLLEELVRLQTIEGTLVQERNDLQQQLDVAHQSQRTLQDQLESKQQDCNVLETELIRVQDTVEALRQESHRMMMQQQNLDNSNSSNSSSSSWNYNNTTDTTQDADVQLLRDEADRLTHQLLDMQGRLEQDSAKAQDEQQHLQHELDLATQRLDVAHRRLSEMEMEKQELHLRVQQLQSQVDELTTERDQLLVDKAETARRHAQQLEEQIHATNMAETRANQLQREKDDMALSNEHLQHDMSQLQCELEKVRRQYEQLQQDRDESYQRYLDTQVALKESQSLVDAANATIQALQAERDTLHDDVRTLEQTRDQLESKLQETEHLWRDAVDQVRHQQQELSTLRTQLTHIKTTKSVKLTKFSKLKRRLSNGRTAPKDAVQHEPVSLSSQPVEQDSTELKKLQEEATKQEKEIVVLQREIESMESKCFGLKTELSASTELVSKLEYDLETNRRDVEVERSTNQAAIQQKVDALCVADEELAKMRLQLEESRAEQNKHVKSIQLLEQTVDDLVSKMTMSHTQIVDLQKKLTDVEKTHDALEDELQSARAMAESYKLEKDQSVLAALALKTSNEELTAKVESQSNKIIKLAKFIARTLKEQNNKKADGDVTNESDDAKEDHDDSTGRVSGMPMIVALTYNDRISGSPSSMKVKAHYTGPVVDGLADGPGMLRFDNGDMYLGSFDQGLMLKNGSYIKKKNRSRKNSDSDDSDMSKSWSIQAVLNDSTTMMATTICG